MSFACKTLCKHKIRRPHFTCLSCRIRRLEYGKVPPNYYEYDGNILRPKNETVYVLSIDEDRRFRKIKYILLNKLLTICEWLAN